MLWKGVRVLSFARFFRFFRTTLFAVLSVFVLFNAYAVASCPSGYVPQTNVFQQRHLDGCASSDVSGIANIFSFSQTSTAISDGGGDWVSYFQDFRVKGRAYCSITAPTTPADTNAPCATWYPRQPMAADINTTTPGGTHCWCQATGHQKYSPVSQSWAAPFQKIYTNYVYLKDMGDSCENSCAAYCSYMGSHNTMLEFSRTSYFTSENLRATIYDSPLKCIPVENKITYINKTDNGEWDIIDYDYYNNSVKLKEPPQKINHIFKGWCETEVCDSPFRAGNTMTGWSGAKTLYAQWERTGCEIGVKMAADGTCTDECEDGYEPQINPFYAEYSWADNDATICAWSGSFPDSTGSDWYSSFMAVGFALRGHSFCSMTEPTSSTAVDTACGVPLVPMAENIDTKNKGEHCWCQMTEYEQQLNSQKCPRCLPQGTHQLESKYVYAGDINFPYDCEERCPSMCNSIIGRGIAWDLRVSMYRSLKKCIKSKYTLTLQDGDRLVNTISDYTVTDKITLSSPPEKEGYEFVGWCEDLNNCDEPLTGTQTGLSGTKTLYAKWIAKPYGIEYSPNGSTLSKSTPMVYTVENPVTLEAPIVEEGYEFEAWVDENTGQEITILPTDSIKSGPVKLAARLSVSSSSEGTTSGSGPVFLSTTPYKIPATCDEGYERRNDFNAILDPKNNTKTKITAFISDDSKRSALTCDQDTTQFYDNSCPATDWVPGIKIANEKTGVWGLLYAEQVTTSNVSNPFYWVYGKSSCNPKNGATPPDNLIYSDDYNPMMDGATNGGANCWCKMTDFQIHNQDSTSVSGTPWVYLTNFMDDEDYTATENCAHNCAAECRDAMIGNAFFRAQIFGDYSACKPETYTITYELNGGHWTETPPSETQYTVVYHDIEIPNTVEREGFEFDGWCEENDPMSSTCKGPDDTITIGTGSSGNRTFYARWKTKIHFNAGTVKVEKDNPGSMNDQDVYYNQENIELTTNEFRRDGYDFNGWTCSVDGDDETLVEVTNNGTSYVINKFEYDNSITCNAQWTVREFNITYQGSSDINIAQSWINEHPRTFTVEEENDIVILATDSENNHYEFAGWCVGENDNCDDNELVQTYTIPSESTGDVYLWAHWRSTTYNITYYKDIEDYNADPKVPLTSEQITSYGLPATYTYGTEQELPSLTREHYNFLGWYYADDLNGDPITSIVVGMEGNKILIAQWEPKTYTITYYKDSTKTDTYTGGEYVTSYTVEYSDITPLPTPTETYFQFDGWTNCNDNVVIDTVYTAAGGDRELCAIWTRVSCPDGNYLVDQTCYSCATETSNLYPYANGITATNISSCYAICPVPPVCPANSHDCAYDDKVDENNINYYNEGLEPCLTTYVCNDHYSGSTCEPETYNVTYYDGENIIGALAENYGTYTFGEGLTLPTGQDIKDYYQKLHYTFVGWYDNAEFEGDAIQEISAEDYGNKVFYSKWEPNVYHIEFSYGKAGNRTTGFTGNTDTQNVNFGDKNIPLNSNGFAIAGYEFDYWTCSATYDNGETYTGNYQNNAEITEYVYNSDMLCEAHWMANSYSLSYNCGNGGELADGQSETVSVDYDAEYVLNNSVCKVRPNYTLINWTCSNDLDLTQSVWNITDNSTCTAHWEETRYAITYLNTDGTQFNSLSPTTYLSSATPLTVPTTNPANTEHADFVGWCDDASLTQNCALTREIPSGSSGDITFYAKWVASACPAGQYLDSASASCLKCESGYTSAAWSATKPEDCYYDWNCEYSCPDNAESCSLVSGVSNGRIYYGSNETYSCDINVVCKDGYTFDASSNQCGANHYNITYYLNNGAWASATDVHPNSYTVETSSISISQPSRDWHSFDGWCVGEDDCNNPVKNFVINPAETIGDIELFAQWSFTSCQTGYTPENTANGKICVPQYYNITYMDGNVELEHLATRFTIEDTTIQLASISNPGYIFDGWCVNTSSCTPSNMVKGILQGPWTVGDKTLYAQWTKEEFVCDSGKYLHIGNDAACLYTQKPGSPAFAVGKGNKKYYLKMTKKTEHPDGLPMNEESNKQINVLYDDELYNVHDASVNDAPVEFFEQ